MGNGDAGAGFRSAPAGETPATAGAVAQVFVVDLDAMSLERDDEHHLTHVLRLRPGETIVVCDGAGRWRRCRFTGIRDAPWFALAPAGTRRAGDDVEACGARGHSGVRAGEGRPSRVGRAEAHRSRCRSHRRVRFAASGGAVGRRTSRPGRGTATPGDSAKRRRRAGVPGFRRCVGTADLDDLRARLAPVPLALAQLGGDSPALAAPAVAVGPEGGWEASEVAGRPLVGLGPHVLRADTAAVASGLLLCALREGVVGPPRGPEGPSDRPTPGL